MGTLSYASQRNVSTAGRTVAGTHTRGDHYARSVSVETLGPFAVFGDGFTVDVPTGSSLAQLAAATFSSLATDAATSEPLRLRAVVAPGSPPQKPLLAIEREDETLAVVATDDEALDYLAWAVNQLAISAGKERYTLLHAAAAATGDGAVVLAAPMESGKTTTCTGLVRHGWSYLTDEAVALDPETLRLHAFPKALTVDPGSQHLFPELRPDHEPDDGYKWHVPPATIRADAVVGSAAPVWVVLPQYVHGERTRLEPLTRGEAVMELAQCTFAFIERPERNLQTLARLVRATSCHRLVIGSLDEAVRLIGDLCERGRA